MVKIEGYSQRQLGMGSSQLKNRSCKKVLQCSHFDHDLGVSEAKHLKLSMQQ